MLNQWPLHVCSARKLIIFMFNSWLIFFCDEVVFYGDMHSVRVVEKDQGSQESFAV